MPDYETLRSKHAQQFQARLPEHIQRLAWPLERIREEQTTRLRILIDRARQHSPWHRNRLSHIDTERLTPDDLSEIPPMTKDDLMNEFDSIVTDERLTRARAESHLSLLERDAYLLDEYHVVASGGSSGKRGVFIYDWEGWLTVALGILRSRFQAEEAAGITGGVRALVSGGKASHMSAAIAQTFLPGSSGVRLPALLPVAEIVAGLNRAQPAVLGGYSSMIALLAGEASAGRLQIAPRLITTVSEPLLPEMRFAIKTAWSCPVVNIYATSEGASAASCGWGPGLHLNDDLCIFEPVDQHGRPARVGEAAAKMYVTPLFNHAQPLIRYELTDVVTLTGAPCSCGSALRVIEDVQGRQDDVFAYAGGVVIHPITFRSILGQDPNIIEYRVTQTSAGATIDIRNSGPVDEDALRSRIESELARQGLSNPQVTFQTVDQLSRQDTGKIRRFVSLAQS